MKLQTATDFYVFAHQGLSVKHSSRFENGQS